MFVAVHVQVISYLHTSLQDLSYCAARKVAHAATKDDTDHHAIKQLSSCVCVCVCVRVGAGHGKSGHSTPTGFAESCKCRVLRALRIQYRT